MSDSTIGIYPDIPNNVYHSWKELSSTGLKQFAKTPAHYQHYRNSAHIDKPAFAFGDVTHAFLLEEDSVADRFMVSSNCASLKKNGFPCTNSGIRYRDGQWFCGTHCKEGLAQKPPKTPVTAKDFDSLVECCESVWNHKSARQLLDAKGQNEVSVVGVLDDVRCRCRCDALRPGLKTIVDIKTTVDASRDGFSKSIFNFGYYLQAAFYLQVCQSAGIDVEHFAFIAIEKTEPFLTAVYTLDTAVIELGKEHVSKLLARFKQCNESGEWPAYGDEPIDIGLPDWAWRKIESAGE